jgi:hypothetical protein
MLREIEQDFGRIVFLDLGDVLLPRRCVPFRNSGRTTQKAIDALRYCVLLQQFDPAPLYRLSQLLDRTKAQLVLISEWQTLFYNSDQLRNKLVDQGITRIHPHFFTGWGPTFVTSIFDKQMAVKEWLGKHHVTKAVIIDGEPWPLPLNNPEFPKVLYADEDYGLNERVLRDALAEFGLEPDPNYSPPLDALW